MSEKQITTSPEEIISRIMDLELHCLIQKDLIATLYQKVSGKTDETFEKNYDYFFQKIKSEKALSFQIETNSFQKDAEDALKSLKDDLGL